MGQKSLYKQFIDPIFLKMKRNSKYIYDKLTEPKVVKISIYISLLTFLPGLIFGLIIFVKIIWVTEIFL